MPPLATGSATPDNETAKVPLVVMGDPVTDKKAGTVIATEVTVPPAAGVAETVIPPAVFEIVTLVPAVSVLSV